MGVEPPHTRDRSKRMGTKWRDVKTGGDGSPIIKMDGRRNKRSVWMVTTKPYKGAHFATFPQELITPCILAGSKKGDMVLDPFNGAGTSGLVAIKNGRRYVGCELNPEYLALTMDRLKPELDQGRLF